MPEWHDIPELRSLIEKWAEEGASKKEIVARLQRMATDDQPDRKDLPTNGEQKR
jgi:hypothetical protein